MASDFGPRIADLVEVAATRLPGLRRSSSPRIASRSATATWPVWLMSWPAS